MEHEDEIIEHLQKIGEIAQKALNLAVYNAATLQALSNAVADTMPVDHPVRVRFLKELEDRKHWTKGMLDDMDDPAPKNDTDYWDRPPKE